ncbi:hypothetical protein GCM10010451_68550 [Streptomyces virens]|uniref:Uncharacterized protein n=1 Tax=Streptomyces virens TaxID=285572 RepID=A0ABP6HIK8_9ACTN
MNRDWDKDMDLCERAGRNQGFAMPHLIAEQPQMPIYWLQQYAELQGRNGEMLKVLERIKADIDEFRSYINIEACETIEDQARAFNELLRAERERANKAKGTFEQMKERIEEALTDGDEMGWRYALNDINNIILGYEDDTEG